MNKTRHAAGKQTKRGNMKQETTKLNNPNGDIKIISLLGLIGFFFLFVFFLLMTCHFPLDSNFNSEPTDSSTAAPPCVMRNFNELCWMTEMSLHVERRRLITESELLINLFSLLNATDILQRRLPFACASKVGCVINRLILQSRFCYLFLF